MSTAASHPDTSSTRMGELLLAGGFVRKSEVENALKLSKRLNQPLCQILQRQQRLSLCEKRSLLSLQKNLRQAQKRSSSPQSTELGCRLGELLLNCGMITSGQLECALEEQSQQALPLGSILLRSCAIKLQKLAQCLQLQQKLMFAAAASLLTLTSSYAVANEPAWGSLQPNFNTQAPHSLRDTWRKPGFTRATIRNPYARSDEIMRSKTGKMSLRLTNTGLEFRSFF